MLAGEDQFLCLTVREPFQPLCKPECCKRQRHNATTRLQTKEIKDQKRLFMAVLLTEIVPDRQKMEFGGQFINSETYSEGTASATVSTIFYIIL